MVYHIFATYKLYSSSNFSFVCTQIFRHIHTHRHSLQLIAGRQLKKDLSWTVATSWPGRAFSFCFALLAHCSQMINLHSSFVVCKRRALNVLYTHTFRLPQSLSLSLFLPHCLHRLTVRGNRIQQYVNSQRKGLPYAKGEPDEVDARISFLQVNELAGQRRIPQSVYNLWTLKLYS